MKHTSSVLCASAAGGVGGALVLSGTHFAHSDDKAHIWVLRIVSLWV